MQDVKQRGILARVTEHIPPAMFTRYLIVGAVNTLFGYSSFAVLTALLTPLLPAAYMIAGALSYLPNVTFSYFNYKLFIFGTKGNYLREWLRCVVVYAGGMVIGTACLPVIVWLLRLCFPVLHQAAPYVAGALLTGANIVISFLGHKNFTFGSPSSASKNQ